MAASTNRKTPTAAQATKSPQAARAAATAAAKQSSKRVGSTSRKQGKKTALGGTGISDENTNPNNPIAPGDAPGSEDARPLRGDLQSIDNASDMAAELAAIKAALAAAQAENAKLIEEKKHEAVSKRSKDKVEKMVPRPKGTAGHHFSIQEGMELGDTAKKAEIYKALVRYIHRLTDQSPINWEHSWSKIPARDKANLFEVCRKAHPILARYVNDWATEEIAKQYLKNKRNYAYRMDHLKRPEGYEHLKVNASKRSSASRRPRAICLRIEDDEDTDDGSDEEDEGEGGESGGDAGDEE
ncbi:hypothetical protein H0H92_015914 [Tricholoma furcatifolium]|nr:hypothetical protein H0H92_015914 [Tricholoma furcatifolium]